MTRILLTGASGFLGSALARHWQRAAVELHLIVRPSSSLRRLESMPANVVIHSVADANAAAHVVTRVQPDVIIHTACTYGRVGESPLQILDANLALGIALLQSALSTQHAVSFINTGTVLAPHVSLYALSKRQFSEWGVRLALREPGQLRFVDLRLQHMYGPGDSRSKFSTDVLQACLRNEPALKLTAGQQRRDFVYIADVVAAYDILLARLDTLGRVEAIDVGSGDAPTVREFVERVHRFTRSSTRLDFGAIAYRENEAMFCCADTTRLRALGWQPMFDQNTGIQATIRKESEI